MLAILFYRKSVKKCLFNQVMPKNANKIGNWLTTRPSEVPIFPLNYLNWNLGRAQINDEDALDLSQLNTEPLNCVRGT